MSQANSIKFISFNKKPALIDQDPSYIYRCQNLAHALEHTGWGVTLSHIQDYRARPYATCVVLHRPYYSLKLKFFIHNLRKHGVTVIADIDDLIFNSEFAQYSPAVSHQIIPLLKVKRAFKLTHKALALVDHITVSTEQLAVQLQTLLPHKPVTVIHNCVHYSWRNSARPVVQNKQAGKIITYSPGTRSHNHDFATILEPLQDFLVEHAAVKLKITGPLEADIKARKGQVLRQTKQPFYQYVNTVKTGWVNLSPLKQTPFNQCKSGLKVIEAGYWGIPTICSPNPDAKRLNSAGAIIAHSQDEWFNMFKRMLDANEYKLITDGLKERTLVAADIHAQARLFEQKLCTGLPDRC